MVVVNGNFIERIGGYGTFRTLIAVGDEVNSSDVPPPETPQWRRRERVAKSGSGTDVCSWTVGVAGSEAGRYWVGPLTAQPDLRSLCHTSNSPTETCKTVQIRSSVSRRIEVQLSA